MDSMRAPTWNNGITISAVIGSAAPLSSAKACAASTMAPCANMTPFGRPVVPLV